MSQCQKELPGSDLGQMCVWEMSYSSLTADVLGARKIAEHLIV